MGRPRHGRLGAGRVRGRLRQRRRCGPVRRVLRPERPLPQRGPRPFRGRHGAAGLRTDPRWDTGCSCSSLRPRRPARPDRHLYLEFDRARRPGAGRGGYCLWKGIPVMCGPRGLPFSATGSSATRGADGSQRLRGERHRRREVVLRLHRRRFRLRRRRLPRRLRGVRLDAEPALPQPAQRDLRGDGAAHRRRPQPERPGAGRAWASPSPTTTRTGTSTS